MIITLLEAGASLTRSLKNGDTPLHLAAEHKTTDLLNALLGEAKVFPEPLREARDVEGHTPLHCAIISGSLESFQWLLDRQANSQAINRRGESSLHLAARANQPQMIAALLQRGLSLNATDQAGNTVLHAATQAGALEAAVTLLKAGITPTVKNAAGQTPRQVAQAHLRSVDFMGKYDEEVSQLAALAAHEAAEEESLLRSQGPLGRFLLKQQKMIQAQQTQIEKQQTEIKALQQEVEKLKGLSREQRSLSPLEIKSPSAAAAGIFKEKQKEPGSLSLQNALVSACERGDAKEVRALLDKGAKPNAANATGKQPLGAAVWGMNPQVVNELLKQAGGVSPMTWEECKEHNLKKYKEVYMVTEFAPETFQEWSELLEKIAPSPFLRAYHLQKAHAEWNYEDTQSWEMFCAYVSKRAKAGDERNTRALSKTEAGYEGFRSQIKTAVKAAASRQQQVRGVQQSSHR